MLSAAELQGASVVEELPDAHHVCVERLLPASGTFVLEVFAGEFVLTLAMLVLHLPCMRPWDTLAGQQFDVLVHGHILISLVEAGVITYAALATPCQSQSWGRFPALRTWRHPLGNPEVPNILN